MSLLGLRLLFKTLFTFSHQFPLFLGVYLQDLFPKALLSGAEPLTEVRPKAISTKPPLRACFLLIPPLWTLLGLSLLSELLSPSLHSALPLLGSMGPVFSTAGWSAPQDVRPKQGLH